MQVGSGELSFLLPVIEASVRDVERDRLVKPMIREAKAGGRFRFQD